MKRPLIILLSVLGLVSCKKDVKTNTTTPPATVTRSFYFNAHDENNNAITNLTGNTFIINFYQNNNLVYTAKTKTPQILVNGLYTSFSINDFKDGRYTYEITDSLNLFGYTKDSLISQNGSWYIHSTFFGTFCTWSQCPSASLGGIEKKPLFTILNYITKDSTIGTNPAIYINLNVSNNVNRGAVIIYFYKNNKVSSDNSYNFAPLYPNSNEVSSTQTSLSNVFPIFNLTQGTSLHSGDSVYFAVYPASYLFYNYVDHLSKTDTLGYPTYTAIGTQRVLIPYKLH